MGSSLGGDDGVWYARLDGIGGEAALVAQELEGFRSLKVGAGVGRGCGVVVADKVLYQWRKEDCSRLSWHDSRWGL